MNNAGSARVDLLIHAADAGPTYLSWILLQQPFTQNAERLDADVLNTALGSLESALITLSGGDEQTVQKTVQQVLTDGPFADQGAERELSRELTQSVLPPRLRELIRDLYEQDVALRLRITPSPRLAPIPWELLCVDEGEDLVEPRRLVEIAEIVLDPPVTVHADRSRLPRPWSEVKTFPALHIIDPLLPASAHSAGYGQTIPNDSHLVHVIGNDPTTVRGDGFPVLRDEVSRLDLSRCLLEVPEISRLLYFGHISSSSDEPGSASLHLSDVYWSGPRADHEPNDVWGMSEPVRPSSEQGYAHSAQPGNHMPLSALDLLLGTSLAQDPEAHHLYGFDDPTLGHQLWPMPSRVALVACEGGVDYRSAETFGLVMAMIDAGAELITTTRWPLPTDHAFATLTRPPRPPNDSGSSSGPTTELALAVDSAHRHEDAVASLRQWQLNKLRRWRTSGDIADTPLLWASLSTTVAPARPDALTPTEGGEPA